MSKGKVPVKKILSIICTVLTVIVVAMAVFVIGNMIYCRAKNKPVSFFGYSFAIVQTPSMEPYIMTGDLIVYQKCSYDDIEVGDYIVFTAGKELQGQSIVHAVVEITEDGIRTRGLNETTNPGPDQDLVTTDNLLGMCTFASTGWGGFFRFINKYGIFLVIALVAVPFIVKQVIKIVKLSKNKKSEEVVAVESGVAEETALQQENSENDTERTEKE